MVGPDSYYTPIPLADKLVSYITEKRIKTAIDFCVGDGVLLKAVERKFNGVDYYGTDISQDVIEKLNAETVNWTLGVCDFRDDVSVSTLPFLKDALFDLIMFNPPFSCKGGLVEHIVFDEKCFKVSTAMMFIMKALKYLSPTGGLYAILPISCVFSQKDRLAWQYLQEKYNACVLEEPKRMCFGKNCLPNIVFVYMGNNRRAIAEPFNTSAFLKLSIDRVSRGCFRMQNIAYSTSKKALRLIHTTNIYDGKLINMKRVVPSAHQIIDGFGVAIPRVCNPNSKKVALLDGGKYVLSDCVIVLRTSTMESAVQVRDAIVNNWSLFKSLYKGTGAQYTTLERVKNMFGIK